ncbi:MAG: GNAT family N-acetyltransferase [Coriobacteriales bacterium]|jgi:GNAT superfamily N-acetyltransferase|nr:GNAT family N-acetyltransferase [Coriobacteriales bacterium]
MQAKKIRKVKKTKETKEAREATLFTIRSAHKRDLPWLHLLFEQDGMPHPPESDLLNGRVAVNDVDEPVGFIRVLELGDETNPQASGAYVYPVIVFEQWRKHGVGKALIKQALLDFGELRLVACRDSRGFYPRCGFVPLEWEKIAGPIARDCELCPDLATCDPQPFVAQADRSEPA